MGSTVPELPVAASVPSTVVMIDTIGANVDNIPVKSPKVAGYVTGSGAIPWTDADWNRFPNAGEIHINQDPNSSALLGHVFDIENGAWTVAGAIEALKTRKDHGRFLNLYCSESIVGDVQTALKAGGFALADDVGLWVADWSLTLAQAEALLGTRPDGGVGTIKAVQWASPSSNPGTPLPGSNLTLSEANCDLSATEASWYGPAAPSPAPVSTQAGLVVTDKLVTMKVASSDGKTWKVAA